MEDISKLTIKELQSLLKQKALPIYYAVKTDLIKRLTENVNAEEDYLEECTNYMLTSGTDPITNSKNIVELFEDNRNQLRKEVKEAIQKIQQENRRYSLRRRKKANTYHVRDLVAVKRTQFSAQSKLIPRYMGPYEVIKVKKNDRYELIKVGQHEGAIVTTSSADNMKLWLSYQEDDSSESDEIQDGRV